MGSKFEEWWEQYKQSLQEANPSGSLAQLAEAAWQAAWTEAHKNDQREHDDTPECWCGPRRIFRSETGNEVWLHHLIH